MKPIKRVLSLVLATFMILLSLLVPSLALEASLLKAPTNLTVEPYLDDEGVNVGAQITFTDTSVQETKTAGFDSIMVSDSYWWEIECKVGDYGTWEKVASAQMFDVQANGDGTYTDIDTWATDYPDNVIFYRARMVTYDDNFYVIAASAYSNIGSVVMYPVNNVSAGLVPDIEKAKKMGFLTKKIAAKMDAPITREEFAEIAVRFYESVTGKNAFPAPSNTFTDTQNPEILKAFALKITAGVGNNKFAPNEKLSRQQMAVMITNTLKATLTSPAIVLDVAGVPNFADQNDIVSWARTSCLFMYKHDITKGVGGGKYGPLYDCTRQQAVAFLVRSYDKRANYTYK